MIAHGHDELRAELAVLGELREEARRLSDQITRRTRALIPVAHKAGLSIKEIGELVRLSRPSVIDFLPVDPSRARTRAITGTD
jgi:hypothetical protein